MALQFCANGSLSPQSHEEQQKSIEIPEPEGGSQRLPDDAIDPEESKISTSDPECSDNDDGPGAVVLDELPLPRMFIPGKIVHIYSHRGVYKATYVPRDFRELRRLSLAGNMLSDHTTQSYYEALLEVRSVRNAEELPPKWTAFDEDDTCSCCASRFTWASTSNSEAQEARDKHNCRSCGTLVCNPCAMNRIPLPTIGVTIPVRVCDRCYNDLGGALTGLSTMTDSFVAEQHRLDNGRVNAKVPVRNRPERQRERRSVVVDDLARRLQQGSTFGA
jgi:FYVE zinc finger